MSATPPQGPEPESELTLPKLLDGISLLSKAVPHRFFLLMVDLVTLFLREPVQLRLWRARDGATLEFDECVTGAPACDDNTPLPAELVRELTQQVLHMARQQPDGRLSASVSRLVHRDDQRVRNPRGRGLILIRPHHERSIAVLELVFSGPLLDRTSFKSRLHNLLHAISRGTFGGTDLELERILVDLALSADLRAAVQRPAPPAELCKLAARGGGVNNRVVSNLLEGFQDNFQNMFVAAHRRTLRVDVPGASRELFNLFPVVRVRTLPPHGGGEIEPENLGFGLKVLFDSDQREEFRRLIAPNTMDLSAALQLEPLHGIGAASFSTGGVSAGREAQGVEGILAQTFWPDTPAEFFSVPIHVGGTAWLVLLSRQEDAIERFNFYRSYALTLPSQIRQRALTSYETELSTALQDALCEAGPRDTLLDRINAKWASVGLVYPYRVPKLMLAGDAHADRFESHYGFSSARSDLPPLTLGLDRSRRFFPEEIEGEDLDGLSFGSRCEELLGIHLSLKSSATYKLAHPLKTRLGALKAEAEYLRDLLYERRDVPEDIRSQFERLADSASAKYAFADLVHLLHVAETEGADAVYSRYDNSSRVPKYAQNGGLDLAQIVDWCADNTSMGRTSAERIRVSAPLQGITVQPYRGSPEVGRVRLKDNVYRAILLEVLDNTAKHGATDGGCVPVSVHAAPFSPDQVGLIISNPVDETRSPIGDQVEIGPGWTTIDEPSASGLGFVDRTMKLTRCGELRVRQLPATDAQSATYQVGLLFEGLQSEVEL